MAQTPNQALQQTPGHDGFPSFQRPVPPVLLSWGVRLRKGRSMADVVLTLDAPTGRHRARVFRLSEAVFRVEVERLIQAYDAGDEWRGEFWSAIPDIASYTDNLERAAELAAEGLRAGQAVEP